MKVYDTYKFFATEEEAVAFMTELDAKSWGYRPFYFDGMLDIDNFEDDESYYSYLEEEDRYNLAANEAELTEAEREAKPYCVWIYTEEFNTQHQARLKRMAENK